jgi:phosphate transport system permease protein
MENDNKYQISRWTLFMDKFMSRFITLGGLSVIIAVLLILVFIGKEVVPLMEKAEVKGNTVIPIPDIEFEYVAVDEWTTLPALITKNSIYFVDLQNNGKIEAVEYKKDGDNAVTASHYIQEHQIICLGSSAGKFSIAELNYKKKFLDEYENGRQKSLTVHGFKQTSYLQLSDNIKDEIVEIRYAKTDSKQVVAGIVDREGQRRLILSVLEQAVDLFGEPSGELEVTQRIDLTNKIKGRITHIQLSSQADTLVAATSEGEVHSFREKSGKLEYNQTFKPFKDEADKSIASLDYIFGSSTLILTNKSGRMLGFSTFKPSNNQPRVFGKTKNSFPDIKTGSEFFAKSLRNKSFISGSANFISLRYSTHESVNWEKELEYEAATAVISGKYDKILVADKADKLHIYDLKDPHPEAGMKAYFGKVWYEGQSEPIYKWESTGGTEEKEKQLSMMPLIFGTLKATFYALLFAVPIALLAAIYTAQFLPPKLKTIIKPLMEVMASLPSVIIGFLAAIVLAPMVEDKVPSIILVFLFVPASAIIMGVLWQKLPPKLKFTCAPGMEFIFFLPVMLIVAYTAWLMGPGLESVFFTVTDANGKEVANFSYWWHSKIGLTYTQKNALIVGFAMGFAVIPIIFTISEDSISNVPKSISSASLALGASRWQTTWRVVLPTASAGIFSACMIGLGRAVGETMIVLCAAGGTDLMEMNIFSGMRTLSINLATELPEAAKEGTLYRSLFLGALILFIITFMVNTAAEIIRQHIRNKYKTI